MPEIASLSVGLHADLVPIQTALQRLNAYFEEVSNFAKAAGVAIDRAFAGEAQKQATLQAALARTALTVEDLAVISGQTGLTMNAAFSSQAAQFAAIGASATAATLQIEAMRAAGAGGGAVPVGAPPTSAAVGSVAVQGINEAEQSLARFGAAVRSAGTMVSMYLSAPIALLSGYAIKLAADFEQSMARIQSTFNLPQAAMKQVSDLALKLGADVTLPGTSALDAAQALQQLMSSGLSLKDAMAAARPVLQLAAVAMIDNKEAALITAQAINAYNLSGRDAAMVTDLLTNAMRATGLSAEDVAKGLTTAGAAAQLANQSIQDIATAEVMLERAGMTGAAAGTALTTMFLRIVNPTQRARDLMEQFNIQVRNMDGSVKPLPLIFEEFRKKLQDGVTYVRAFGGDTDEMEKKLKKAEGTFKTAQRTIADLGPAMQLQTVHMTKLNREVANVDAPSRKLSETISDQKAKLNLLTEEMKRHNEDGLAKMARNTMNAKDRIAGTTLEITLQERELRKLKAEQLNAYVQTGDTTSEEYIKRNLEIIKLSNSIKNSKLDILDYRKTIQDSDRQMRDGLDSTKQKALQIDHLSGSLKENQSKLDEWNKAGRAEKVAELNASIASLNQQMKDNRDKLIEAAGAQEKLNIARQNATLVNIKMTQEDRDKIVGDIFGQRGFKPIELAMHYDPKAYAALKKDITEVGTTNRIAIAIQDTMNGKIDGLRSAFDNLAISVGQRFTPQIKSGVEWLTRFTERLNQMTPKQIEMVTNFAKFAIVIGPALIVIGAIVGVLTALTTPIGLVVAGVAALGVAFSTNFGGIRDKAQAFVSWIKPALQTAWNAVKSDFFAAWGAIQQLGKEIWPQVQEVMQRFAAFVKAHGAEIKFVLSAAWDAIKGVVQIAWSLVSGIIRVGLDILSGDWRKAWGDLGTMLKGVWDGFIQVIGGGLSAIGVAIKLAVNGIFELFKGLWDRILTGAAVFGTELGLKAAAAAHQLITGLANGISNGKVQVVAAIVSLAADMIGTLRTLLQIRSPSAVMHEAGRNIGQGLADGITSSRMTVAQAMAGLGSAVLSPQMMAKQDAISRAFAARVVAAAKANDLAMNAGRGNQADILARGYYDQLGKDAQRYDSLTVGGKTINRSDVAREMRGTHVGQVHIHVNGVTDAASFNLSRGQIMQAMYQEMQSIHQRNG